MSAVRFMHELECLELGILGPSITEHHDDNSIDAALALLSPEEARRMKRKFRKVARRMVTRDKWKEMTRKQKRNKVRREMYMKCVLRSYNMGYAEQDNDI